MANALSHFDEDGASRMVDVGDKKITERMAVARGVVGMLPETLRLIRNRKMSKGDVLEVARLAGIMAAKRTPDLIPLCHMIPLTAIKIVFDFPDETSSEKQSGRQIDGDGKRDEEAKIAIEATVRTAAQTGVEMEALTAVSVAALTIYDMCKGVDRGMTIRSIQLLEKSGGKSGHFVRE